MAWRGLFSGHVMPKTPLKISCMHPAIANPMCASLASYILLFDFFLASLILHYSPLIKLGGQFTHHSFTYRFIIFCPLFLLFLSLPPGCPVRRLDWSHQTEKPAASFSSPSSPPHITSHREPHRLLDSELTTAQHYDDYFTIRLQFIAIAALPPLASSIFSPSPRALG